MRTGVVGAQFMVSWGDRSISTRAFTIRVEPVIVGRTESEDGFIPFVEIEQCQGFAPDCNVTASHSTI